MSQIVWRQAAIDDLDNIYDYIAQDAPIRAASFAEELTEKAGFLAANPNIGETKIDALPCVRVFPHKNYLFLFTPLSNSNGIELLRIIHGAQDYLTAFTDDF